MRLSVERLRLALVAGASLLVLLLAVWIGLGRYHAIREWQRILKRSGATLTHETDGYTYSQSLQGRTVFTLHAAKAIQHTDGKWGLHDVVLTLYGRVPGRADRVYGSDFEYDEKEGVARALGEVHMDLQAPSALASAGRATPHGLDDATPGPAGGASGNASGDTIHVRTSGLVYVRKLGVAATDQDVEFVYRGLQCHAKGAEFNSSQGVVHLLADVRMQGEAHGQPVNVTAEKADLDRTANVVNLQSPVVRSAGRTGSAVEAVLHLRKDGSVESAQAERKVVLSDGSQTITANRLDASFNAQVQPEQARLSGGVVLSDTNPLRSEHGTATQVDISFDPHGAPQAVRAATVKMLVLNRTTDGVSLRRELSGDHVAATLVAGKRNGAVELSQLHVTGGAKVSAESLAENAQARGGGAPLLKTTEVAADDLLASFLPGASGGATVQRLTGAGHTSLVQKAPYGAQQSSSGEELLLTFAPGSRRVSGPGESGARSAVGTASASAVEIASAVQTGNVTVHSRGAQKPGAAALPETTTVTAQRAEYTAATDRLKLSGHAQLEQENLSLTAAEIALDTTSGDATAQGSLVATLQASRASTPATHVMADEAHLGHASRIAEFDGSAAHPAKMWQGASQIEAANLVLDGERHTLSARPARRGETVHAVFAEAPRGEPAADLSVLEKRNTTQRHAAGPGADFLRVSSAAMDYNDVQRQAVFAGGVQMEGTLGRARSDRAVLFLSPAATAGQRQAANGGSAVPTTPNLADGGFGGSLQRAVLLGGVQMEQPGRHATGEQLTYTAASNSYVLTGTATQPPHVVDAEQGSVSGTTLLFGNAGSTIIVAGQEGKSKSDTHRVHTEIVVKHPG